jgi:hypothetical protein
MRFTLLAKKPQSHISKIVCNLKKLIGILKFIDGDPSPPKTTNCRFAG